MYVVSQWSASMLPAQVPIKAHLAIKDWKLSF